MDLKIESRVSFYDWCSTTNRWLHCSPIGDTSSQRFDSVAGVTKPTIQSQDFSTESSDIILLWREQHSAKPDFAYRRLFIRKNRAVTKLALRRGSSD
jgi:hypothetical protein